jgi:hypothetical protein
MLTRSWECATQRTLCLFSGKTWDSPAETLEVCASEYGFDLRALRKEHGMDFYDGIRVINFVRKSVRARSDRAGPSRGCRHVSTNPLGLACALNHVDRSGQRPGSSLRVSSNTPAPRFPGLIIV